MNGLTPIIGKLKQIRLLPPQDKVFYEKFNEMAHKLTVASDLLEKLFSADKPHELAEKIRILETEGDLQVRQINDLLDRAQQPPFDRDYISELIHQLDDIMDFIERASNRFILYRVFPGDETMRQLAGVISACCQSLRQAILLLPKRRGLDPFFNAISDFEEQSDKIYHQAIAGRFARIIDDQALIDQKVRDLPDERILSCPLDQLPNLLTEFFTISKANREYARHISLFFVRHEIYMALEDASDACETASVILKRMVTSNG